VREHLAPSPMRGIDDDTAVLTLFEPVTRYVPLEPSALPAGV